MSEQGKIQRYDIESVDGFVESTTCDDGDWCSIDDVQELEHRLTAAEAAATEYAKQAAELQEETLLMARAVLQNYYYKRSGPMSGDGYTCRHCGVEWYYLGDSENHNTNCPVFLAREIIDR